MLTAAAWAGFIKASLVAMLTDSDVLYNKIMYAPVPMDQKVSWMLHRCGSLLNKPLMRALDSDPTPLQEARVYGLLGQPGDDCARFLPRAREAVASAHSNVRVCAMDFLARTGEPADAALFLPLLSDEERFVRLATVQALERLGDARTVQAINVWLIASDGVSDEPFREYVRERRDNITRRLAGLPPAPVRVNPYPTPTAGRP